MYRLYEDEASDLEVAKRQQLMSKDVVTQVGSKAMVDRVLEISSNLLGSVSGEGAHECGGERDGVGSGQISLCMSWWAVQGAFNQLLGEVNPSILRGFREC